MARRIMSPPPSRAIDAGLVIPIDGYAGTAVNIYWARRSQGLTKEIAVRELHSWKTKLPRGCRELVDNGLTAIIHMRSTSFLPYCVMSVSMPPSSRSSRVYFVDTAKPAREPSSDGWMWCDCWPCGNYTCAFTQLERGTRCVMLPSNAFNCPHCIRLKFPSLGPFYGTKRRKPNSIFQWLRT